jgi:hypothetical protein
LHNLLRSLGTQSAPSVRRNGIYRKKDTQLLLFLLFSFWGEMFSFGYSLAAIAVALAKTNYVLIPINLTACVGFGMMLYWSWQQRDGAKHG